MKKIISIFVCIGILLFSSISAWDPSENKDFFVDPETGEPNAIVVVGANAAASDVTAAANIAKKIGAMLYYEEETVMKDVVESWNSGENFKDDYGDNMNDKNDKGSSNADAILIGDTSGYFDGIPYQELKSLWWNDKNRNKKLDKNESREEIYVNLWGQNKNKEPYMLYPIICNPLQGRYEYRVVVEGEAQKEVWEDSDSEEKYTIYKDPVSVKFLREEYNILHFGENGEHRDYAFYGTPQLKEEVEFEVGETKEFDGWEIKLDDINLYEHIIKWIITEPSNIESYDYMAKIGKDKNCVFGIKKEFCEMEETIFALESLRILHRSNGENTVVANVYTLEDYGIIHDAVTIKPCGPDGFQWSLDVIRDVDIEYWDGNPYYIIEESYDDYNYNDKTPDFSDSVKENVIALKFNGWIDPRVCSTPPCKPPSRLLRCWEMPQCGIDDFWVNTGDAPVFIELVIDDAGDLSHSDLIVDGGFSVTHYRQETEHVKIDPMSLIVNDDEVTDTIKTTSNLILVGGPGLVETPQGTKICNTLTKELCDQKLSTVDWFNSVGEYEYIPNAFAEGKDVLIVAGKDREATQKAVEKLINDLNT